MTTTQHIVNTLDVRFNQLEKLHRSTPIHFNTKWSEYRVTLNGVTYFLQTVREAENLIELHVPARPTRMDRLRSFFFGS